MAFRKPQSQIRDQESPIPNPQSSEMEYVDRILSHLERRYLLSRSDRDFLEVFCSDFNIQRTAEVLGITEGEVKKKNWTLQKVITNFCMLLSKNLKTLAYEELVKSLKQTKSEYLKAKAMELIFKAEGIVKEPEVNVVISVEERTSMIRELNELVRELKYDGRGKEKRTLKSIADNPEQG